MSPQIVDDMADDARSAGVDGVVYGLGTGFGRTMFGPIGHAVGGVAAASYANDMTLTRLAIGEGTRMLVTQGMGGGGGGSGGGGRRRM